MKRIFTTSAAVLVTLCVFAQTPQKMSYQAVIRDASNALVTSHAVGMQISILQGSLSGTVVYTETQTPTTNANGLVSIEIGGGTGFDAINWANGPYFIKTETDPTGGTSYTITGTSQFLSVPYALYAEKADNTDALLEKILQLQAEVGVNDKNGNHYKAVKIGNQVWMAENLKVTSYNNGIEIPQVTVNEDWLALTTPAFCWYNNDEAAYKDTYGALYNWFAASANNLCPVGWHVPTDAEWDILINYLIANSFNYDGTLTGNKVAKALASKSGWTSSLVTGAVGNTDFPEKRNVTGFMTQASGYRYSSSGIFYNLGNLTILWSSSDYSGYSGTMAWKRLLSYDSSEVNWSLTDKPQGCSIRCLKDN